MGPLPVAPPGPSATPAAIAFDLFGTLVQLRERTLHREVPRLLGVPGRRWVELVREQLLRRSFADVDAFASFICRSLTGASTEAMVHRCARAVEREADSAIVLDGVVTLLRFLKGRGFRLAVASNVSSVHRDVVWRFNLQQWLEACVFSCDVECCKPEPAFYRRLCDSLGLAPDQVLVVGDSWPNDVLAPRALGMPALHVARASSAGAVGEVAEVGLLALAGPAPFSRLVDVGDSIRLGGSTVKLASLCPLPDGEQGRHNLVFAASALSSSEDDRRPLNLYVKRYLEPASAYVEELAYQVQGMAGLPTCRTTVIDKGEPLLVVESARGEKFDGDMSPSVAREIGRHFAFGYVFANADLQPRNAFLAWRDGVPTLTMVDMEHCFLNLAVRPEDLGRPRDPAAISSLTRSDLARMARRRVLNERTLPRFRAAFLDRKKASPRAIDAFAEGFLVAYAELRRRESEITALIVDRLGRLPALLIGTAAYRRAMGSADVEDIRLRLAEDASSVLARLLSGPC
jgi:HAD superfamily hydrolase (TIGR01509 family)